MPFNEAGRHSNENIVDSYCAAWNEQDKVKRLLMLTEALTPDVRYVDPAVEIIQSIICYLSKIVFRFNDVTITSKR